MVEISLSGSGEGLGWVTSRGYSTARFWAVARVAAESGIGRYVNLRLLSADSRTRAAWNSSPPAELPACVNGSLPGFRWPPLGSGWFGDGRGSQDV